MSYTREQIKAAVESKGYRWFNDDANKTYDVNIVGIRNAATGKKVTNVFGSISPLRVGHKGTRSDCTFY